MAKKLHPATQQAASQVYQLLVQNNIVTQAQVDAFLQSLVGSVIPPVVVPPVTTGDVFTANSLTPGIDANRLVLGLFKGSEETYLRTLQTPTSLRKAGVPYVVKWDGRETPGGPVVADKSQYKVRAVLSRVTSKPGWGVGNTSDNADNNMRSSFCQAAAALESEENLYFVDPFDEAKPWLVYTKKTEQKFFEVLGADWFVNAAKVGQPGYAYDGWDIAIRYNEGGRHLRQDATYLYVAVVYNSQDRRFNSGVIRIRKSDHALVPFTAGENFVFGNSGTRDQNTRPGILGARHNNTYFTDADSIAQRRAYAAQTRITGLAVNATYIAIARAGAGVIDIYQNNAAGTFVASVNTVAAPGAIDWWSNGTLGVITGGTLKTYSFNGTSLIPTGATYAVTSPIYFSAARSRDEGVVQQAGTVHQNFFFNANGTKLSKVWGLPGGKMTNTNIDVTVDEFLHVNKSALANDAVDREAYGETGGSITYSADDSALWMTDWGHARVLSVNSVTLAYRTQVAWLYDFLEMCVDPANPNLIVANHLGFFAGLDALTGGDQMKLPAGQRNQFLLHNYAAGRDQTTWGSPRCITTLKANTVLASGFVVPEDYTYLLIPDSTIVREPGRPYLRLVERRNSVLRDTGQVYVAYNNGGEDTHMDADGTFYRHVPISGTQYKVAIARITSIGSDRNPVVAAEVLTPAINYTALDVRPTKPYGSPTRIKRTKYNELLVSQMLNRRFSLGSAHLATVKFSDGRFAAKGWFGTDTEGLTGRNEYPEANEAYGSNPSTGDGPYGANADTAGEIVAAHFNAQRAGATANSQFIFRSKDLLPLHEWQVADGDPQRLSFPLGAAGNIMDMRVQQLTADRYRTCYTDESDGSKVHVRIIEGVSKTGEYTFNGADVFDPSGPTYGRNIFNVNDTGVTAGVLIRPDYGGAQNGTGGFTGTVNYLDVTGGPGLYVSNYDLVNSAWYSADNEGAWLHASFKDTKGVRPAGATKLRVSGNGDLHDLMILEGELLPEDGSYISYSLPS